jgi:putative phage-type endonuclease
MQVFRFKHGSKEWLSLRKKVITATEIAALVGLHEYKSLAALSKKEVAGELLDNQYMRAGRISEPGCVVSASEAGFNIEEAAPRGMVEMVIDDTGLISASLDAVSWDEKLGKIIVECKTTDNIKRFFTWVDGDLPPHYLLQIQTQLGCMHLNYGYYVGMLSVRPYPTIIYKITANPRVFKLLTDQVKLFRKKELTEINKEVKIEIQQLLKEGIEKISSTWMIDRPITTFDLKI